MSYSNVVLYGAVIPRYKPKDKDGKKEQDIVKVDDPRNREKVRKIFESFD
ncbi:MAG: hypothetical protein IKU22_08745 [Alistipes sp.]|nr:hypothetical protein [Alistipes sp.]